MRNLILGFLLGILVATGTGVWAQTSGTVFDYGEGNIKTFSGDGISGTIFPYTDTYSTYSDSTGRSGSFFTYPGVSGTGTTSYSFSGGKPC